LNNNIIDALCEIVHQSGRDFSVLNAKIFFEKQKLTKLPNNQTNQQIIISNDSFKSGVLDNLKQRSKIDFNKFYIQNELKDLRFNYFDNLNKAQLNFKPNITPNQTVHLKEFLHTKPFSIIQCDKNIGSAIVSHSLLDQLCNKHLQNRDIYQQLQYDPLLEISNTIESKLNYSINRGALNININKLITKNSKLGKFRILCKLHKKSFGIRPIINNRSHPTSQLCKFIDLLIKPILYETPSYLKDSQHLLQKCENLFINNRNVYLYSMDFESLYTNIDKNDAINRLTEFLSNSIDLDFIQPQAINSILTIIFDCNGFVYKDKFFMQKNGLEMGSICGPSVASLYVFILEKPWLNINQPLLYGRFIDDIVLITNDKLNEVKFIKNFLNLKLNICEDKTINFLDLSISFNTNVNKLKFSLYIKPTNTFSYLRVDSNHPNFIFKNIPKSLFIRIKRICTNDIDSYFFTRKLIFQLLSRGYNYKNLVSIQLGIGNLPRKSFIDYKIKSSDNFKNSKTLLTSNEFNKFIEKKDFLKKSFDEIRNNFNWLQN
jgi:hypothetical protein